MSSRARWTSRYEKGLVDVLIEYNLSHYRGYNGWCTEGWNKIVKEFSKIFSEAGFSRGQLQDKKAILKKDYKAIKTLRRRSGISWNHEASMISTTPKKWAEIIGRTVSSGDIKTRAFLCMTPWVGYMKVNNAHFYARKRSREASPEDSISSPPPLKMNEPEINVLDAQDEEDSNMYSCQKKVDMARVFMSEMQDQEDEQLDGEECDIEQRAQRRAIHGSQRGRLKRQNSTSSVPRMEETMAVYFKFKKEQASSKDQALKQGNDSIARCFQVLHGMTDVSDEIKICASDVFKDATNREFFLCYEPRLRGLWLKREVEYLEK